MPVVPLVARRGQVAVGADAVQEAGETRLDVFQVKRQVCPVVQKIDDVRGDGVDIIETHVETLPLGPL